VHFVGFIIRIYQDARSSEYHILSFLGSDLQMIIYEIPSARSFKIYRFKSRYLKLPSFIIFARYSNVSSASTQLFRRPQRVSSYDDRAQRKITNLRSLHIIFLLFQFEKNMGYKQILAKIQNIKSHRHPSGGNCSFAWKRIEGKI
jgi:hypothetical protein